ncbi:BTAD domain-containing putative transcriptional regulator [Spirilliplanes yamanashiensis]|uniref:SARP family transcriptional regulator n=1 Tax=Spirilliplanes yamanashiensis TaxID=42233 RepID=A0A8J3Y5Y9_9ACTN|nr:BTAD domain-containing putative transcriptional regulator [Spirilliplanes yamanashiensis]MDP9819210.1 putative ATPase/DNA-binding SARP family transcriptional activator [Spirilliplanes yamanashiensis]GIJ01967.1 SARP family transcriptional regulator [Spirilliplanes yamanashiensis]
MRVGLLGPLDVRTERGAVELTSARQRAVVAVLAMAGGAPVPVDRLVDALWGDDPPPAALNSLQSHVARVRRALGGPDTVLHEPAGYRLAVGPDDVDAVRFERLLRAGRLDEALALWRGTPVFADSFARGWAVRLAGLRRTAREDRAAALLAAGRPGDALADLRELVAEEPAAERPTGLLLRALAACGRPAEAIDVYAAYRTAMTDELGLDPAPSVAELHRSLLRGDLGPAAAPPDPAPAASAVAPAVAAGVPVRGSSFVGRRDERAELARLLAQPGLVSVTGPGGVGKTRLVAETVAGLDRAVSWVDVADVRGRDDLLHAVAVRLGARPGPGDDLLAAVGTAAARAGTVLVLDNCEHVVDPAAELVEHVRAAAPAAVVAVTSQERLRADGERVLTLEPLPAPAAARLFRDRAGLGPADPQPVDDIVARLDALPLAIELAAVQAGPLGLDGLRDRLDDRLELLSRGRRTSEPRHRTLRALVDWSYGLLDDAERRALRRLSVFAAGFTLDLAERVIADDELPRARVAPLVACLVDRSLVARHAPGRFRLLETVKAYAAERLREAGEDLAGRHAAAVVAVAEELDATLAGPDEATAVRALTALLPELRLARRAAGPELRVRLAAAMAWYGYHGQRYEVLGWAVGVPEVPHPRLPVALAAAGTHAWGRGDQAEARALGERALALGGDVSWAHNVLGDAALVEGDADAALPHYEAVAELGRARGLPAFEAFGLCGAAMVRAWSADVAGGVRLAEEAVRVAAASGNPTANALAAYALGEALGDHEPARAVELLRQAAATARTVDCRLFEGAAGTAEMAIRSRHGDPAPVLAGFRDVLAHWRRTGNDTLHATALRNLLVLLARIGADEPAALVDGALGEDPRLFRAEAERLARARAAVAERLGPERLAELRARGAALSPGDLLDTVLTII